MTDSKKWPAGHFGYLAICCIILIILGIVQLAGHFGAAYLSYGSGIFIVLLGVFGLIAVFLRSQFLTWIFMLISMIYVILWIIAIVLDIVAVFACDDSRPGRTCGHRVGDLVLDILVCLFWMVCSYLAYLCRNRVLFPPGDPDCMKSNA